jgi:hypothetical protein
LTYAEGSQHILLDPMSWGADRVVPPHFPDEGAQQGLQWAGSGQRFGKARSQESKLIGLVLNDTQLPTAQEWKRLMGR